jgi:hypothetical protein
VKYPQLSYLTERLARLHIAVPVLAPACTQQSKLTQCNTLCKHVPILQAFPLFACANACSTLDPGSRTTHNLYTGTAFHIFRAPSGMTRIITGVKLNNDANDVHSMANGAVKVLGEEVLDSGYGYRG